MSVKIRLKRMGRKKQTTFRIVVAESRNPRGGKVIETVGHYTPYLKDKPLKIDLERVDEWRSKGAKPTEAVKRLLRWARRGDAKVAATAPPAKKKEAPEVEKPVEDVAPAVEIEETPTESQPAEESSPGLELE